MIHWEYVIYLSLHRTTVQLPLLAAWWLDTKSYPSLSKCHSNTSMSVPIHSLPWRYFSPCTNRYCKDPLLKFPLHLKAKWCFFIIILRVLQIVIRFGFVFWFLGFFFKLAMTSLSPTNYPTQSYPSPQRGWWPPESQKRQYISRVSSPKIPDWWAQLLTWLQGILQQNIFSPLTSETPGLTRRCL